MRKTVEVDFSEGEGEDKLEVKGKVVLKKLSFGEKDDLEEEASEVRVIPGAASQIKVSTSKAVHLAILKATVSWNLTETTYRHDSMTGKFEPVVNLIPQNIEGIRNLPQEVGIQLFMTFLELNTLATKK